MDRRPLLSFLEDERAQGLVEYALILMLVSTVALAALHFLGGRANNSLNNSASTLP